MEGTSHPAPPTGGFRMTGNSEQYAFKKVNIEEYVKSFISSNLLPAGGAMSITEHWHLDVFKPVLLSTYEIWGRLNIACLS